MFPKLIQYFFNLLLGIDHLSNAVLGGNPDETLSARLGRNYPNSFLTYVVNFLFGKNHCKQVAEDGDSGKEVLK